MIRGIVLYVRINVYMKAGFAPSQVTARCVAGVLDERSKQSLLTSCSASIEGKGARGQMPYLASLTVILEYKESSYRRLKRLGTRPILRPSSRS